MKPDNDLSVLAGSSPKQNRVAGERTFDRYWRIRVRLPERFGQRLRVLARGTMNSAWVEFEDGTQHIVSRNAFRKVAQ